MPIIIDGKKTASEIRNELKVKTENLKNSSGVVPGLALLLVGNDPASEIYVKSKDKACEEIGFHSTILRLPVDSTEEEVLSIIKLWNEDKSIHGILVQLPLPKQISEQKIIEAILPEKDVDGFHPINVGKLNIGIDAFAPCTPAGVIELLRRYKINTNGKHAVIVGRSNIVGKPMASLLLQKGNPGNCTVTICHSGTENISEFTKSTDILVAAIGKANFITADMIKDGVVIIDVGINRVDDLSNPKGYKVVGDVDYENVFNRVSAITPVPGGVGPMTIAMLLENTYKSALKSIG